MREAARGTTDGDFLRRAAMNPSRNFFVPSSDGQPCSLLAANNHPAELATNATKAENLNAKPTLVLMRGLSGSGKSTLAAKLAAENGGIVISADDYFVGPDGVYRHDRSQIRQAHIDAQDRIAAAFRNRCRYVIADNTHITRRDMEAYLGLAARFGTAVELVEPTTPWAWDAEECAKRNVHQVPRDIVIGMRDRYQTMTTTEAQEMVAAMCRENTRQSQRHFPSRGRQEGRGA